MNLIFSLPNDYNSLYFDDSRRFGKFHVCYSLSELHDKLKMVGHDLMNLSIRYYHVNDTKHLLKIQKKWVAHFDRIKTRYRSARRKIFPVLLEQNILRALVHI